MKTSFFALLLSFSYSLCLAQSSSINYSSKSEIESLLAGSWTVQEGITVDGLKTIKFGPENHVTLVDNRGVTGGPNYYRNGTKMELKYNIVTPGETTELDINIYREGNRVGIMRGLLIFKGKEEFNIAISIGENRPRPKFLEDSSASIIVNVKKDSSVPEDPKTAYNYYSEDEKQSLYREDFDARSEDWSGQISGEVSNSIQNGNLVYSSLNNNIYRLQHELWSWEVIGMETGSLKCGSNHTEEMKTPQVISSGVKNLLANIPCALVLQIQDTMAYMNMTVRFITL